ncbi:MAG: hypothetical protein WBG18_26115 [Xanthobacteraceae bacterium]|jgi:predicted DNA-binding transcriptional regulator AlpA
MAKAPAEIPAIMLEDRVVRIGDAASTIGVCPETLRRYIVRGVGPRVTRLSERKVGIRIRDLRAWLESRATPVDAA